jgi:hypothetical protein
MIMKAKRNRMWDGLEKADSGWLRPDYSSVSIAAVGSFEGAWLHRPLKKPEPQIPHRLKSVRDDKNKGP